MLKLLDGYLAIRQVNSIEGLGKTDRYEVVNNTGCGKYLFGTIVRVKRIFVNAGGKAGMEVVGVIDRFDDILIIEKDQVYGTYEEKEK